MAEHLKEAVTYIEQGHVRVGPEFVTDPAFLLTRNMEDFITWVDSSTTTTSPGWIPQRSRKESWSTMMHWMIMMPWLEGTVQRISVWSVMQADV